ncbi:hypothetical protein EX895_006289 [Sporisorium graminicola]|uniref:Poly(A) RNA polymerase mitochondrial-like central palm domain-containing protein n=1 Tax=Sporisorium graminicola TaxID=280036 RepID=A0A4V6EUW0_9BASI|nr:hypothetical protein EX895_006289 [Sporisorium graminicola]TKY85209.1 hypothetical protein EX895_006289 [Sporisorium graminicola]
MAAPTRRAQATPFKDSSFDEMDSGNPHGTSCASNANAQTIDGSASSAFFGGFQGASSPLQSGNGAHPNPAYGHGFNVGPSSPSPAMSGWDPISKLGFASNRASPQTQLPPNGLLQHSPPQPLFPNHRHISPSQSHYPLPLKQSLPPAHASIQQRPHHNVYATQQRNDDSARRTAEVERRNRLREEEKARRTSAINKQVDEGMAAFKLDKQQASQRTAEVERRNRQREEEKERRRVAIQKQVDDGIKTIQAEKKKERAFIESDRLACRKWLTDLSPVAASSSSTAEVQATDTVDLYAAVGRQLRGFWEESRPAASSQMHRSEVISDVQQAIDRKWPGHGLQVAAFGSSVTGLITESSDLDLVLLDPTRPYGVGTPPELRRAPNRPVRHSNGMPEWYSTNQVANALRNSNKFRNIVPISGASVPIVKMVHRNYDIPADININDRFGLFNSQLIQAYADLQPQVVRPLIFFLKHWYSRCDLNDPAGKHGPLTFSSYTIALMALQVLQLQGVLPNLQSPTLLNTLNIRPSFLYARLKRQRRARNGRQPVDKDETPAQKYNVTFSIGDADMEPYRTRAFELSADDAATNDANAACTKSISTDRLLGRMFVAFVHFYTQFDRRAQAISVVNGSPLPRSKASQAKHAFFDSASEDDTLPGKLFPTASRDAEARAALREEHSDIWVGEELVVQDPFIIDRNTSRNIKAGAIDKWQGTMESAFTLLGLQKGFDVKDGFRVRLEDAPLILDLCVPQDLRDDMDGDKSATGAGHKVVQDEAIEPWRLEEEAAAQARELAKQAAQKLRREKKKQARSSKPSEARRLQEEAAMVEDMIDGIESGQTTAFPSVRIPEVWRLRPDGEANSNANSSLTGNHNSNGDGKDTFKGLMSMPFTFSVSKSPAIDIAPALSKTTTMNGDLTQQLPTMGLSCSPTASTKTDSSSDSEDIDLVALRLEQSTRVAGP